MKVNHIETLGYLSGQRIGRILPFNIDAAYPYSMNTIDKEITKDVPTLAIDGSVVILVEDKNNSYVELRFLEEVSDIKAKVVSSVRMTVKQFYELKSEIEIKHNEIVTRK